MAKGFLEVVGEMIDDAVNPKPNRSRRRKVLDTPAAKASEDAAWEREQAKQNDKVFAAVKKAADEGEFDELVPGDFTDMGRTNAMEEAASEEFGGEFPDTSKSPSEPMGNVTTVVAEPKPAGEKARFDGADILDEADIARRADVPQETLAALFKKTHGGSFDPKLKVDKAKMATITSMIGENRDLLNLSPTQFALRVYARKK